MLASSWVSGAHALLIDSFDTDALVLVNAAAPASGSATTPDSGAGMIGNRGITVNKTAGAAGFANAAIAEVVGGLLGMSNGPVTNSVITIDWSFGSTDLTEAGTKTGIFLALPDPIDNDLTIGVSINGGSFSSLLFPDGSSGPDFFFPFLSFANSGDAATATSVVVRFTSVNAWDAQVDFIESIGPPPPGVSEPASLALLGMGLAGVACTRRRRHS
jgi:hypothetical protein